MVNIMSHCFNLYISLYSLGLVQFPWLNFQNTSPGLTIFTDILSLDAEQIVYSVFWGHFNWKHLPAVATKNLNLRTVQLEFSEQQHVESYFLKWMSWGRGGCWIILPFMCETGGLSVPCVYVLLSLTWCNGTCSNNSGEMASQRDSLQKLSFAATLCLIWILLEHEWLVSAIVSVLHRNWISSFLCANQ